MTEEDTWDSLCLICASLIVESEKDFTPCRCGFRMCVWCFHKIVTLTELTERPRCPGCRAEWDVAAIESQSIKTHLGNPNQNRIVHRHRHVDPHRVDKAKRTLVDAVCVDSRVVLVLGLPTRQDSACFHITQETLVSHAWFGQYGRILALATSHADGKACIRYSLPCEATRACTIAGGCRITTPDVDPDLQWTIAVVPGKAKWCPFFLRNELCPKKECIDLHEPCSSHTELLPSLSASRVSVFSLDTRQQRQSLEQMASPSPSRYAWRLPSQTAGHSFACKDVASCGDSREPFAPRASDFSPLQTSNHARNTSRPGPSRRK